VKLGVAAQPSQRTNFPGGTEYTAGGWTNHEAKEHLFHYLGPNSIESSRNWWHGGERGGIVDTWIKRAKTQFCQFVFLALGWQDLEAGARSRSGTSRTTTQSRTPPSTGYSRTPAKHSRMWVDDLGTRYPSCSIAIACFPIADSPKWVEIKLAMLEPLLRPELAAILPPSINKYSTEHYSPGFFNCIEQGTGAMIAWKTGTNCRSAAAAFNRSTRPTSCTSLV